MLNNHWAMDDLDSLISQRQAEAARRQRELDLFIAETRGMEVVRDLRAGPGNAAASSLAATSTAYPIVMGVPLPPKRGGRQPGAISQQWRVILWQLYHDKAHGFSEDHVIPYAKLQGITIKMKDARDRMEKYKSQGFIDFRDGRYFVSQAAAVKFDFARMSAGPAVVTGWQEEEDENRDLI